MTQTLSTSAALEAIEARVFENTQSFIQALHEISMVPVETEADVLAVKAALDQLTTDMQALSNSLIVEGPRSGILLSGPILGTAVNVFEGAEAAAA